MRFTNQNVEGETYVNGFAVLATIFFMYLFIYPLLFGWDDLLIAGIGMLVSFGISRLSKGKAWKDYIRGTTGSGLTTAQMEQNAFTMQQQTAQQQFNAEQAALNREWQERMSNTAYQRGTADMVAAGLNPAMMYGGSSASASTPSGGAASSAAPAGSSPSNVQAGMIDNLLNLAFAATRLKGLQLDNEGKEIENSIRDIDLNNHEEVVNLTKAGLKLSNDNVAANTDVALQAVQTGKADELLKLSGIDKNQAETALSLLQGVYQDKQNKYFDEVKEFRVLQERLVAAKTEEEIKQIHADIGLTFAKVASEQQLQQLYGAEITKTMSETRNIDLQNQSEEVRARFAESGAILSNMVALSTALGDNQIGISGSRASVFGQLTGMSRRSIFGRKKNNENWWKDLVYPN